MSKRDRTIDKSDKDAYTPVRETFLRKHMQDSVNRPPPKNDRDMYKYEEYLRNKHPECNDIMPESFDPHKLEAARKARVQGKRPQQRPGKTELAVATQGHESPTIAEPQYSPLERMSALISDHSFERRHTAPCVSSPTGPGNESGLHEHPESQENKILASSSEPLGQPRRRPPPKLTINPTHRHGMVIEQPPPTPRILTGSRPPLSASAYYEGGVPCLDDECQGSCRQCAVVKKGRPRAPSYFPFKSRAGKPSKSSKDKGSNATAPNV
ncbi:hypothetical protein F4777DRAFT_593645 [Nemania sp. FL0916]|nr:hypothetical protein F4777DRAFT_593645 [Nemania sp. FL0916]